MNSVNEPAGIFAVIMAVAVAAPYLSDVLGLPVVASMTLIGIILGPQVSGILEPNILIQFIGSLGMIYVFFSAGTEVNLGIIRKHTRAVLIFGTLTFLIPFAFGVAFGLVLFGQRLLSAVLLGAFFASSGSLIIQPILRSDLLRRESAEVGRGGASLSRVLVAAVVVVSGVIVPEGGSIQIVRTIGLGALYFAVLYFALPKIASFVIRKARMQGSTDAIFMLFLVFASAALGLFAGIPGYIGAFCAGLFLSPVFLSSKSMAARIDLLGDSLFLPFLLIFIGASADFSQIPSLPVEIALIAGSAIFGIGAKYFAAFTAGKILGYSPADRGLLFGFSSSFAAFSLAIASVAGSSGLFDQPLVSGAIILVILSSVIASLAARNSGSSILVKKPQDSERIKRAGERIIVALSKPGTSHYLMELGIALNGQDTRSPLFPLAILSDNATESDSESRQHAETMLAAAVMQGVSSQVSVIPVSRISINVAQGILDSAVEQNADTIIVGWNRPPRLSNAFFGSVIDQIVTGGNQLVFVARAVAPFSAAHIVAVVPSLCDRHPGFQRAAAALGALSKKNQAKLHIVTLYGQGAGLSRAFKDSGYGGSVQTIEVESWKEIGKGLKQIPAAPKLFALLSARPSEPSWHPAIERLPHRIGEEFPDSNLVTIYLAGQNAFTTPVSADDGTASVEMAGRKDTTAPSSFSSVRILEKAVSNGTIRVNMRPSAIADGGVELVSSAFPFDRKLSSRLGTKLTETVQRQPIEIEPGVVLIHDRVSGIEEPVICLGSHRKGFRISLLDRPVQVLIILFVPEEESPEDHLAFLGGIAHLFKEKELAARLIEADIPEDLL